MQVIGKNGRKYYIMANIEEISGNNFVIKNVSPEIDKELEDGFLPFTTNIGINEDQVLFVTTFTKRRHTYDEPIDVIDNLMLRGVGVKNPIRGLRDLPVFVFSNKKITVGGTDFLIYTNNKILEKKITAKEIYKKFAEFVNKYNALPVFLLVGNETEEQEVNNEG